MSSVKYTSYKAQRVNDVKSKTARALEVIGGTAEGYAKQLCPVDTGNLRNSITHEMRGENKVAVCTNVHYAPYVELGTRKMRAQPYLRPAVENHHAEYEAIAEQELKM